MEFYSELAAMRVLVKAMLIRLAWAKYSPDQPRAAAGQPTGGEWVNWNRTEEAMGLYDEANRTNASYNTIATCSSAALPLRLVVAKPVESRRKAGSRFA
ncbi:MAG: hypothetical protein ACO1OG_09990 [Devosia sp.]